MAIDHISFRDTNYFSDFICNYIEQDPAIAPFYHRFPTIENYKEQLVEKQQFFTTDTRQVLTNVLQEQYATVQTSAATAANIEALAEDTTFTVTTGHQLNLFTGPLYFLYKIVSAINLTKQLKESYPTYNFVPVYWMATEDHDFAEINYFNLSDKKIQWNRPAAGAVGRLDLDGLDAVLEVFAAQIGIGHNAATLKKLFKEAYTTHNTLAAATRFLVNELFAAYGLVIIDADHRDLKQLFIPYISQELTEQTAYHTVMPVTKQLKDKGYKVQVNPREINLFYLASGVRERIIQNEKGYYVHDTTIAWDTLEALLEEVHTFPERFSPNVMMRPLYQEVILPNICYIGGGGELAYWLELKAYFQAVAIPFPILLLRNSVLLQTKKQAQKVAKLSVSDTELFLKQHELINRKVRQISDVEINFDAQREHLRMQFKALYEMAEQTDPSFLNAVKAQEKKQLKGLDVLEKRLLKAQRIKLKDHVQRLTALQYELFPNQSLQERTTNFATMYLEYGEALIPMLIQHLDPLIGSFIMIKEA